MSIYSYQMKEKPIVNVESRILETSQNHESMPARESGSEGLKYHFKDSFVDKIQLDRNDGLKQTPRTSPIYPYKI